MPRTPLSKAVKRAVGSLRPTHKVRWTREGGGYFLVWLILLVTGLYQQINMILLIAGLTFGPFVGSFFVSAGMLRGLRLTRKQPPYVFAGEPLVLEYQLENGRRWSDALAINASQALAPADPSAPGAAEVKAEIFFPRVAGLGRDRQPWRTSQLVRGRYRFRPAEVLTRSPFGLLERGVTVPLDGELLVYPTVGSLTRRWRLIQRQATETRRGTRHDRSLQQMEYHGLRDYRPGDSPRWIHWRTTARIGEPMVKEFEQQSEQDLAILIDPWLPRTKPTSPQRDLVEEVIRCAATICLETCRSRGRRLLLGWTGPAPGLIQSPASVKLLHELLEALALLRPSHEGSLSRLLDALPNSVLREAFVVVITTRPLNLQAELEASHRAGIGPGGARMAGRIMLLDASRGDLRDLVRYDGQPMNAGAPPIYSQDDMADPSTSPVPGQYAEHGP